MPRASFEQVSTSSYKPWFLGKCWDEPTEGSPELGWLASALCPGPTLGIQLRARGIGLHVLGQGIDTATIEGRAMFGMPERLNVVGRYG